MNFVSISFCHNILLPDSCQNIEACVAVYIAYMGLLRPIILFDKVRPEPFLIAAKCYEAISDCVTEAQKCITHPAKKYESGMLMHSVGNRCCVLISVSE